MTVSSALNRKSYAGDDVSTSFTTSPVEFFETSNLQVYVSTDATGISVLKTENTHYTVSGGDGSTGTVNLAGGSTPHGALLTGTTLVILRVLPFTQADDFVNNDGSDAEVVEERFDREVMLLQQVNEVQDRTVRLSEAETATDALTELPFDRASKFLAFNASKELIASDGSAGTPASAFMATVLDDTTAAIARGTLDVPSSAEAVLQTDPKVILPGGRLTLTTAVPVTTADVTGVTTVYYSPYQHDVVGLYNGTIWVPTQFTELSQATTDATKSPAAVANNSNYDMFVWDDAGTLRCTRGPAWTSDTGRGTGAGTTELERLQGRYVNKIAITNGPAAQRGLYVGTIRSNGSAQINDAKAFRHVWNAYNRVQRTVFVTDTTDTWNYTTQAYRQANANAANQIDLVIGLSEDLVEARVLASWTNGGATNSVRVDVGIGLDSTTVNSATLRHSDSNITGTVRQHALAYYYDYPGIGRHFLAWLEWSIAAGTTTWSGDAGGTNITSGITGRVMA